MDAVASRTPALGPVILRVADLGRAQRFYAEVLGFGAAASDPLAPEWTVLRPPPGGRLRREIHLTTATRPGAARTLWLELEATTEVLDLYMLAQLHGCRTGTLAVRRGVMSVTIVDPDGHLVELSAAMPQRAAADHPGDDSGRAERRSQAAGTAGRSVPAARRAPALAAFDAARSASDGAGRRSPHPLGSASHPGPVAEVAQRRAVGRAEAGPPRGGQARRSTPRFPGREVHPGRRADAAHSDCLVAARGAVDLAPSRR